MVSAPFVTLARSRDSCQDDVSCIGVLRMSTSVKSRLITHRTAIFAQWVKMKRPCKKSLTLENSDQVVVQRITQCSLLNARQSPEKSAVSSVHSYRKATSAPSKSGKLSCPFWWMHLQSGMNDILCRLRVCRPALVVDNPFERGNGDNQNKYGDKNQRLER